MVYGSGWRPGSHFTLRLGHQDNRTILATTATYGTDDPGGTPGMIIKMLIDVSFVNMISPCQRTATSKIETDTNFDYHQHTTRQTPHTRVPQYN